jgi:hypothetical protein
VLLSLRHRRMPAEAARSIARLWLW